MTSKGEPTIGQIIRAARLRRGLSQYTLGDQLAAISGRPTMGRDRVARWERGRQVPRAEWRKWLAAVLDVPLDELDAAAAVTRRQNRFGNAAGTTPARPSAQASRRMQGTPALLPVFRSRVAAGVLAATLLNPERTFSLTELAEHAGASLASTSKETDALVEAGILVTRHDGAIRLTQAATGSPLVAPLTELVRLTYGVPQVIAEEIGVLRGVQRLALTGTWARRFTGVPGHYPETIEVRVLATGDGPDPQRLESATQRAARRLRRPVYAHVVTAEPPDRSADDGAHSPAVRTPSEPVAARKAARVPHQRDANPLVRVEPTAPPSGSAPTPGYTPPGTGLVDELVRAGQVELISGVAADEGPYLELAGSHLTAAEQVTESSPGSAFILICQAAQLIGSGLLAAQGLRPAPGADPTVLGRVVTDQFGPHFTQVELLRQRLVALDRPLGRDNRVTSHDVRAHLPAVRTMLSRARALIPELALFA